MENTPVIIQFLSDNWEIISALIGWIAIRVFPTKRNLDIVELALQFVGKLIPNRRVDSLGNKVDKK